MATQANAVFIQGLDKLEVFKTLWENAKIEELYSFCDLIPPSIFDYNKAKERMVPWYGTIMTFLGRNIWVNFNATIEGENFINTKLYNDWNGAGKAEAVIKRLREAEK